MKKKNLLFLTMLFCMLLCLSPLNSLPDVQAKAKPKLNKKVITISAKKSQTLTLKNAPKKVKWSTTNKKVAKISKTSGKYKQKATITAKNPGSCYIIATVKKKKYRCKLTVPKTTAKDEKSTASVTKVIYSKEQKPEALEISIFNGSATKELGFYEEFSIEKYTNNRWEKLTMKETAGFKEIYMSMPPKATHTYEIQLENYFDMALFVPGKYRIKIGVDLPLEERYSEFSFR